MYVCGVCMSALFFFLNKTYATVACSCVGAVLRAGLFSRCLAWLFYVRLCVICFRCFIAKGQLRVMCLCKQKWSWQILWTFSNFIVLQDWVSINSTVVLRKGCLFGGPADYFGEPEEGLPEARRLPRELNYWVLGQSRRGEGGAPLQTTDFQTSWSHAWSHVSSLWHVS